MATLVSRIEGEGETARKLRLGEVPDGEERQLHDIGGRDIFLFPYAGGEVGGHTVSVWRGDMRVYDAVVTSHSGPQQVPGGGSIVYDCMHV